MKILISNNIALNGGDAAILFGMIEVLKKRFGEDTQFVVSGSCPEVCKTLYPELDWCWTIGSRMQKNYVRYPKIGRILNLVHKLRYYCAAYLIRWGMPLYKLLVDAESAQVLKEYAESDYIISSGGTYLIEPYGITSQYLDYRVSLILKKPLIMYTQSMGPFVKSQTRKRLRKIFDRCDLILLRDEKSAEHVRGLGLRDPAKIYVVPDAAFALGEYETIRAREDEGMKHSGNVAISVREWVHSSKPSIMENYRQSIAKVVVALVQKNYKIHFISTCQGEAAYTDDNREVEKILASVPQEIRKNVVTYNRKLSLPEIQSLLREMDFIVATRLHMSILALISGTPVFPIAYEFKTSELYYSLGYDEVVEMENVDTEQIALKVERFISSMTETRRHAINLKVKKLIEEAKKVPRKIGSKVLFFVASFPCVSETFVLNQIVSAIQEGYDVRIYSWGKGSESCTHEDITRYKLLERTWYRPRENPTRHLTRFVIAIPILVRLVLRYGFSALKLLSSRYGHPQHSKNLLQCFIAERFLRENWKPDVVVSHFGDTGILITALRNAGILRKETRCFTFFHAHEICRKSIEETTRFYRPMFNRNDVLLPISHFWEKKLIASGASPEQVKVVRMGVDLDRFTFRNQSLSTDKELKILSVGRLVGQKGFAYAIRGVAEFCRKYDGKVRYAIIGAGPLKAELDDLVESLGMKDVVTFLGAQPQQVVAAEMENADAFLLPSVTDEEGYMEGIPVALMEAMARGLICISTRHSGVPELIEDGVSGYLCEECDAHGVAVALDAYVGLSVEDMTKMQSLARRKIENEFDVKKETEKLMTLMEGWR